MYKNKTKYKSIFLFIIKSNIQDKSIIKSSLIFLTLIILLITKNNSGMYAKNISILILKILID